MLTIKKHPQFILAMKAAFYHSERVAVPGINRFETQGWLDDAQSWLIIGEREALEKDPTYRQLLPYVIVRQTGADGVVRYLPYRRTDKIGESKLAGNVSVGYGGHIDMADIVLTDKSVVQLKETLLSAALRELVEELDITINQMSLSDSDKRSMLHVQFAEFAEHFILDDSNAVGRVHVGIICVMDVPTTWTVSCAEAELETMTPMTGAELLAADLPLENWTRLYLEKVHQA